MPLPLIYPLRYIYGGMSVELAKVPNAKVTAAMRFMHIKQILLALIGTGSTKSSIDQSCITRWYVVV